MGVHSVASWKCLFLDLRVARHTFWQARQAKRNEGWSYLTSGDKKQLVSKGGQQTPGRRFRRKSTSAQRRLGIVRMHWWNEFSFFWDIYINHNVVSKPLLPNVQFLTVLYANGWIMTTGSRAIVNSKALRCPLLFPHLWLHSFSNKNREKLCDNGDKKNSVCLKHTENRYTHPSAPACAQSATPNS